MRVIPKPDFVQWGSVQTAIEEEAREAASLLLGTAADEVEMATGARPETMLRIGEPAAAEVMAAIEEAGDVRALILGAAAKGAPGPLVSFFTGERAGSLPCFVIIVPGGLSTADLERLA